MSKRTPVHATPGAEDTEVLGYVAPAPSLAGMSWDAWAVVPDAELAPIGSHASESEAVAAVRAYREAAVYPLECLRCGKPDHRHSSAVAAELADHLSAAQFYGTCPGDVGVMHRLYPKAFPTPGPYVFTRCEFVEHPEEECWHVTPYGGETLNDDEGFDSEYVAREWAADRTEHET